MEGGQRGMESSQLQVITTTTTTTVSRIGTAPSLSPSFHGSLGTLDFHSSHLNIFMPPPESLIWQTLSDYFRYREFDAQRVDKTFDLFWAVDGLTQPK